MIVKGSTDLGYQTYAGAELSAVNFEVGPNSVDWQPLSNADVRWRWNIAPKHDKVSGEQRLNASIRVQIRDKTGKVISEGPVWKGEVKISIYDAGINKDQFNITSLLGMIWGAGITVPWLYDRIRRRSRRKQKELPQDKIRSPRRRIGQRKR